MSEPNRTRTIQLNFRVNERERDLIYQNMERLGTTNREAYLRKMAIDGYILWLDLPQLKELVSLMRRTSNNFNQIARRVNETSHIYDADITDLKEQQERIWTELHDLLSSIHAIR